MDISKSYESWAKSSYIIWKQLQVHQRHSKHFCKLSKKDWHVYRLYSMMKHRSVVFASRPLGTV